MVIEIILMLFCVCTGTGTNYFGVSCVIESFNQMGGSAIWCFSVGILFILVSLVWFAMFAMIGRLFLEEIKGKLKGADFYEQM